jgi:hypothetical protein
VIPYLIAHTNRKGTGVAQVLIEAQTFAEARVAFKKRYPDREITASGVRGKG